MNEQGGKQESEQEREPRNAWLTTALQPNHIVEPSENPPTAVACSVCNDVGMLLVRDANGRRLARPCACQQQLRLNARIRAARIPMRYQHCELGSFTQRNQSQILAYIMAKKFIAGYPFGTDNLGLLITGSIGVGKTHLAVGILLEMIKQKGVNGLFCDYRELLKEIQNSYNPQVNSTELEVLRPVFEAEVLVLDELGAQKPTGWVEDTVALILNTRYNDKRTTIITTNNLNLPSAAMLTGDEAKRAAREVTLGDRIGDRMRSRLAEMCVHIEVSGKDFRQDVRQGAMRVNFD